MIEEKKTLTPIQKLNSTALTVQTQVEEYVKKGRLNLPVNYSAGNALKQFQLMVQDDSKLMSCTQSSLAKCMLDMCILGLNPSKQQCYAVPFGNKATLMPSYEGNIVTAKRVDSNIKDIVAKTVHKGEVFEFENKSNGYYKILKHQQTLETLSVKNVSEDIIGAYATIFYYDGQEPDSVMMPLSEIFKRWKKSSAKPFDDMGNLKPTSVHAEFPDKMCERTLINAACYPIIRKSDDSDLFGSTARTVQIEAQKAESDEKASENMCNGEVIDIEAEFSESEENLEDVNF